MLLHWAAIAVVYTATVAFTFAVLFVCVCVCMFDSQLHWCCYCFLEHEAVLTLLQSTQLLNGDLVAWCQLGKQPSINRYLGKQIPTVGISGAHTFICKTWYSLLQVTSPTPGGFDSKHLCNTQVSQCQ